MIDWYTHEDEHTIHHVYYKTDFAPEAFGLSPPEDPDPIGYCDWCEEDIWNDDYIVDGDIICPACWEYWNSHEIAVDFIKRFYGSMPEIAKRCKHDMWMEAFADYMREAEPEVFKQIIKKDDTALPSDAT